MGNGQVEWTDADSPARLEEALAARDHATAGGLVDALCADLDATGRRIDAKAAKKVLAALRKYTWFEKLKLVAEKFDQYARDDIVVLRHLAQARIEMGEITTAVGGLLGLKERVEGVAVLREKEK